MIGAVALMFFMFDVGFRLSTPGFIENEIMDLMDFIKMGFFFMGFVMGFMVISLMNVIAGENNASANFMRVTGLYYWVWGTIFLLTVFGFLIYFIWWIPKKVEQRLKIKRESEEL